jgi:2-polyprenyl-3-methyl-5-hydroxy-6-metoxy-1,4-benzoquinol methylase
MDGKARLALSPTQNEIAALQLSSNDKAAAELIGIPGSRVLDIGCGDGKFTRRLSVHTGAAIGIDVKANKIEQARSAAREEGVPATFVVASGEAIPAGDETFDVVVFSNSLHHMPSPAKALADAVRVLKSGGVLYVMEPVAAGNYQEATCLVNDETQVRREAYEAMAALDSVREEQEIMYRGLRTFANFEDWYEDQIDRDARRKAKFDEQPDLVRKQFLGNARQENGKLAFDQVFRINLLRKL